jgi:NAD(P)H-hydrate epimerase
MINKNAKRVISVDIPSGVQAGTGRILGCAVQAAETVTFAYQKTGSAVYPGAAYAGIVHVEDISLPPALINRIDVKANMLTDKEAGLLLPQRKERANKGSFGKVVIFAGSNDMPGAAALASSAAYMVGCGLVCACVVPEVATVIHHWQREVVTRNNSIDAAADELKQAAAIVIGPGLGRGADVTEFVREIISMAQAPVVLDADALFAVSEDASILKQLKAPCVITPHPGEMSRLSALASFGKRTIPEILDNTIDTAVRFSGAFNVVTLLKDARTIIAHPDGRFYVNTTGNNALSKAGTGDVLSGMIAGFIAQGADPFFAGVLSAHIHGRAGEAVAVRKSRYGVIASDLLECIPYVINGITTQQADDSVS